MNLFFSEYKSDYSNYIFSYVIWGTPESHETPADIFNKGFLPNSKSLDRFYLCRNVRVDLERFLPSSENRRVLRKGSIFETKLYKRSDFDFNDKWLSFCLDYADTKFGNGVMSRDRILSLVNSPIVSHLLLFKHSETGEDVGLVFLFLDSSRIAFYYYSFYNLDFFKQNLGMYMMTSAVSFFKELGYDYIYLGSCYSRNALYKTQFNSFQFFNGFKWSENIDELKFLIDRDNGNVDKHLFENDIYLQNFYPDGTSFIKKS